MKNDSNFRTRYGKWAIVAGASEGLGAEYARELASRGLDLVLVARRSDLLQSLSAQLSGQYGVQTRTLGMDLSTPDSAERIVQAVNDLEIGLLVYNAAYSTVGPFLYTPIEDHIREINTNVRSPLDLTYRLGQRMVSQGRGGIVLMSSLSSFQGSAYISAYAATKAFNIVLAEGLWEEWRSRGVDILVCVAGALKTPNYLASQPRKTGGLGDMAMEPVQVALEALNALGKRPYIIPGSANRMVSFVMRHLLPRKSAVKFMGRILRGMYEK